MCLIIRKLYSMKAKKLIGLILTALGFLGIVYTAMVFANSHHMHTRLAVILGSYIGISVILLIGGFRMYRNNTLQEG